MADTDRAEPVNIEYVGGPLDGRVEAFPGVPPLELYVPCAPLALFRDYTDTPPVCEPIRQYVYKRAWGFDGELYYYLHRYP